MNRWFNQILCSLTFVFLLGIYEVLPTEPLHDMKGHISEVVSEIIPHLSGAEKTLWEETLELVAGTKEQLRGSDYREMAIVLATMKVASNTMVFCCFLLYSGSNTKHSGRLHTKINLNYSTHL